MLGLTIGIARRGFAIALACTLGGIAFAQETIPTTSGAPGLDASPGISVTPAPNAAAVPPPASPALPQAPLLTQAQLEHLVAPVALYPDPLIAQILMASTYPLEVAEAARCVSLPADQGLIPGSRRFGLPSAYAMGGSA